MKNIIEEFKEIVNMFKGYIKSDQESGVREYSLKGYSEPKVRDDNTTTTFASLRRNVLKCRKCRLSETRSNVVFGQGNPNAELMFVGEAPGYDEDKQGLPFVGKAGQLLTKIIEAMKFKREDVYIANIIKCRPPGNRNPANDEIAYCCGYLEKQIEFIKPKIICCLGKFAAQTLLETDTPISRLRGKLFDFHGVKVIPTYHPAYLLRNPNDKKLVWQDMQKVMEILR